MQMQMMGTPVSFASCVPKSSKEGIIQCLQRRSWVQTPPAKVKQSMKESTALRTPRSRLFLKAYFKPQ